MRGINLSACMGFANSIAGRNRARERERENGELNGGCFKFISQINYA